MFLKIIITSYDSAIRLSSVEWCSWTQLYSVLCGYMRLHCYAISFNNFFSFNSQDRWYSRCLRPSSILRLHIFLLHFSFLRFNMNFHILHHFVVENEKRVQYNEVSLNLGRISLIKKINNSTFPQNVFIIFQKSFSSCKYTCFRFFHNYIFKMHSKSSHKFL